MTRLKELRQAKKLTQQELADYMQITRRGYQKWEDGTSNIKPEKAKKLADYFGVSVGYLLGYDDNDFKNETDIKVSLLDETLKKLHAINDGLLVESDEGPSMWSIGFGTAIVAIESFKKEIEDRKEEENQ